MFLVIDAIEKDTIESVLNRFVKYLISVPIGEVCVVASSRELVYEATIFLADPQSGSPRIRIHIVLLQQVLLQIPLVAI